ncbi:MAG: aminotransferase class III-fold pyridoxal phosphate-dependent enzyme [Chloroflexi bacterium]|nr:aminotransferase class III-fold pyridoxal phosphate-dependent enzyme [Chloroflexota bacterium]
MTNKEIIDLNREYVFFTWATQSQVNPIPAVRSEGVYFWDAEGKRYLDFSSQLVNVNIGHGNQRSSGLCILDEVLESTDKGAR